jgi:hypothetical protein
MAVLAVLAGAPMSVGATKAIAATHAVTATANGLTAGPIPNPGSGTSATAARSSMLPRSFPKYICGSLIENLARRGGQRDRPATAETLADATLGPAA